jgi:ribosomal protein L11 methylase PrmA
LETAVAGLAPPGGKTEWADYYQANNNYSGAAMERKEALVGELLRRAAPTTVWDLGANDGRFSRLALAGGAQHVVAWDVDPACVEANYRHVRQQGEAGLLPLLLDLTNPTPAMGWAHAERMSLAERGPADVLLALGLVHHLAISNNVPLTQVAQFLRQLGRRLIVEWVPKEDSQVQKLLASRPDIFPDYERAGFERACEPWFVVEQAEPIAGTHRVLYLMKGR